MRVFILFACLLAAGQADAFISQNCLADVSAKASVDKLDISSELGEVRLVCEGGAVSAVRTVKVKVSAEAKAEADCDANVSASFSGSCSASSGDSCSLFDNGNTSCSDRDNGSDSRAEDKNIDVVLSAASAADLKSLGYSLSGDCKLLDAKGAPAASNVAAALIAGIESAKTLKAAGAAPSAAGAAATPFTPKTVAPDLQLKTPR